MGGAVGRFVGRRKMGKREGQRFRSTHQVLNCCTVPSFVELQEGVTDNWLRWSKVQALEKPPHQSLDATSERNLICSFAFRTSQRDKSVRMTLSTAQLIKWLLTMLPKHYKASYLLTNEASS